MRAKVLFATAIIVVLLILTIGCERKVVIEQQNTDITFSGADYVGSDACAPAECHASIYATFTRSGHPYKLNKAADVEAGSHYPAFCSNLPGPPAGVTWDAVSYVIGGYWWKARFVDTAGYIITGSAVQYNFENNPLDSAAHWTGYHDGEVNKPYDCGRCHTTAFDPDGQQDNLPGMDGSWAFPGVHCEECHGPASLHIANPKSVDMIIDRSADRCGQCHFRDSVNVIPTSKGFVKHHEQWNEMATTKHYGLDCVTCHDPHVGLHPNNPDRGGAIIQTCERCHFQEATSFAEITDPPHFSNGVECIDCHMAYTGRSAVGDTAQHVGDIRSHLWRINTDSTAELTGANGANGYITLDYSCLVPGCHLSETKGWAADHADEIH